MSSRDQERFRRQLEKQLRADVELLYAGYCAKLRAYEAMQLNGNGGDLDPRFLLPAGLPLSLPAFSSSDPTPAPVPSAPPVPAAAPAPAPRQRRGDNELYHAVHAILDQLPELFTRREVCAALGYEPRRSSLHHVLQSLVVDGWTQMEQCGEGRLRNLYRKLPVAAPQASDQAEET